MPKKIHTPFGDTPPPVTAKYVKAPHAYEFGVINVEPGTEYQELVDSYLAPPGQDGWMVAHVYPPKPDGGYDILVQRLNVIRPDIRPGRAPSIVVPG